MTKHSRLVTVWARSRRGGGAIALALLLAGGCQGVGFFGGDAVARRDVPGEQVAAASVAAIGLRVGNGVQKMLLLVGDPGDVMVWSAAGRNALVTNRGHVVRTVGLAYNLGALQLQSVDVKPDGTTVRHWTADFPDLSLYGLSLLCTERTGAADTVVILGLRHAAIRKDENCESDRDILRWSFENHYWVDAVDGRLWRSVQHVHPRLGDLEIVTLRSPALKRT